MAQTLPTHHGIDYGAPNLDNLGVFYIIFAAVYSVFVLTGLMALYHLRHTHAVRIRSFPIVCGSVLFLHAYLLLILLVYPLNGLFKCGWEFWIMSILLPLGIALFQASNVRLYSYAKEQKDLAQGRFMAANGKAFSWKWPGPMMWLRQASIEQRTYVAIGLGILAQFAVTITLFFSSRKFHGSYGFFADHVDANSCRRGPEWVPSVFWQFLWSTLFGPFILLRIRRIHDTHYWAWQTRLAVLACLPGTPLWLIFVYAPGTSLGGINMWFPPSGWFLPGLITMQLVMIIFPLLDVYKLKRLEKQFGPNRDGHDSIASDTSKPRNPYSMATLEMQLSKNPSNLLYWAYTKEFTAENIMFLTSVRDFKRKWEQVAKHSDNFTTLQLSERFEDAALIYFKLVNPQTARLNINIDYRTFNELQTMFKDCRYEAFLDDSSSCSEGSSTCTGNVVAPWADVEPQTERPVSSSSHESDESSKLATDTQVDKLYQLPVTEIVPKDDKSTNDVVIPAGFSENVFDRAYDIVKNDVYLNTWVRYEARYSRPRSPSRARTVSFAPHV